MATESARLSLIFSALGHVFAHLFEPIFYIAALVLPAELGLPYEEVLGLIVAAKLLYGLLAPLAGWLGDRWSTVGMMAVYFLGLGAAAVSVGLASGPWMLGLTLALTGAFGAIYHPVGTAWLIRNAHDTGKAVGVNGVFGGLGAALAGVVGGGLIALAGWRAAFIVPGLACLGAGAVFLVLLARGRVVEVKADRRPLPEASKGDTLRAGLVLTLTMVCAGLVYQAAQPALPKLFEERLGDAGLFGAAAGVTVVYLIAGFGQLLAGALIERLTAKGVYILAALIQVPLLLGLAFASGWVLVGVATLAMAGNLAGIPAENVLMARYSPAKWRATAFGMKFILGFGISGLGVPMVSLIHGATGGFFWLFVVLAAAALTVAAAATLLPADDLPTARNPAASSGTGSAVAGPAWWPFRRS